LEPGKYFALLLFSMLDLCTVDAQIDNDHRRLKGGTYVWYANSIDVKDNALEPENHFCYFIVQYA
jgi:hypothetical protein